MVRLGVLRMPLCHGLELTKIIDIIEFLKFFKYNINILG